MKSIATSITLLTILVSALSALHSSVSMAQVPQGFNYQAIAWDGSGNPIINDNTLQVKIALQTDTTATPAVLYEELHNPVKTNGFGMFNIVIGNGVQQSGTAPSFSAINWNVPKVFINVSVFYGSWKPMGKARLWSVPYSMSAGSVYGTLGQLNIKSTTTGEEPLFEIKNNTNQTVFAVYNKGIRAYVDTDNKAGTKGGFAIGGFGTVKASSQPLMVISPDSARIYIDEANAKASKGGFAIGGFNSQKGTTSEFLYMTPENYFIGDSSGKLITQSGIYNSTFGFKSGRSLTSGQQNVFMGYMSGYSTNTGTANIFVGSNSGYKNSSGYWNILLGRDAGYFNTEGHANIMVGDWAGKQNTQGNENVMIGDYAGGQNHTGSQNVFIGAMSGFNSMAGDSNTYIGYHAGYSGSGAEGSNNIFMGVMAGNNNQTGYDNIAIGNRAGFSNIDGTYNIMIGSKAGNRNESGHFNTVIGYMAGEKHKANYATIMGYLAGNSNESGDSQTLIGYEAGMNNTGGYNTLVGTLAGGSSGTGNFNTYIGIAAGNEATGSQNVFLGKWAGWYETGSNKLIIETNYSGIDNLNNALLYGSFDNSDNGIYRYLRINGQLQSNVNRASGYAAIFNNLGNSTGNWGIKITSGTADGNGDLIDFFDYDGTYWGSISFSGGNLSLHQSSDRNNKENIRNSEINALKTLKDLRIVEYNYIKSPGARHTGYIAQEMQKVLPESVLFHEKENTYTISQASLIPVLHKAILEQQRQLEQQTEKIAELEALVRKLLAK